ncbi:alpha/beta hydrolase [Nocardia panacis]|uniref:Alpha/beta hydrolase n=2 Tax=Nocardia panacis TaxID=2340916 RepID=A0A3A4KGL0_9NOCA|nr:alpha/beta hydrolase [Nocardia panacis]
MAWHGPEREMDKVDDVAIPAPWGSIPARVYVPSARRTPQPMLVFFHGGGWFQGNVDVWDNPVRALAAATGAVIVSVDYRLAPEHPYPAAIQDAYLAVIWAADAAETYNSTPDLIGVAGDSAGATIAAGVSVLARDIGAPRIGFQLLLYPPISPEQDTESYRRYADGPLLTRAAMRVCWERYLPNRDAVTPYANPALADAAGLPPALILTNELDPVRDDGEAYARKLDQAGVSTRHVRMAGLSHLSFHMFGRVPASRQILEEAAKAVDSWR